MKQRLTHNRILINTYQDERKNLIEKKTLLMHFYDELLVIIETPNRNWTSYQLTRNIHTTRRTGKNQKIMEIKNNAAKKIKEGGILSFNELRLLYDK